MDLYHPGPLPWDETQAIYHALAHNGQEGLVVCRPSSRCVCLGLHDDLAQEVDEDYCQDHAIPLIRRDIGGGTVLLDVGQVFFQLILSQSNPLLAGCRNRFFAKFLQPAVDTLKDFHIGASVRPPADIVVNGRKISGNGAGDIQGMAVYTGNILINFDRKAMAGVLKLPGDRAKEWMRISLELYLTTLSEELGYPLSLQTVENRLIEHFADWLGDLRPAAYSEGLKQATKLMAKTLTDREFLELPGKISRLRRVKINEGTYLQFSPLAGEGAMSSEFSAQLLQNGRIKDLEHAAKLNEQSTRT